MQGHKKLSARILSIALSVAMVTTMMPATVFAAEGGTAPGASSIGTIQSFDKLGDRFQPSTGEGASKDVYTLNVELDTLEEDLRLPDELTAMVARTTTVSEPAEDEAVPDEDTTTDDTVSGNQPASPSDAQKEEITDEDVPLAPERSQDEETATTIVEQQAIPVTWNSDKEYKSDENGKFIYTAVIPEDYILADGVELPQIYVMVGRQARNGSVSQRTTTLNLKTISESDTMGATYSNSVYTHASEGWTYDTTESVPVLTLNGVDFNISSGNGVVIPVSITIVIADGTTNSIKTSDTSGGYGKSAIYIEPDQAGDTGTVTIKCDEASLNSLNLEGIFSGIQTMNGDETVVIENVNMKLKAKDNACYVAGFRMNSGTIWATSENYGALYILKSAITLPVGSTIVGSKDANVEDSALTAAALSSDSKKIKMGADGTGDEAKTVKITPPSTTAVAFSTLTANGTANTTDTTELTLTFDKDVTGLAADDITVTGATKGTLTKESGTGIYKLAISNITVDEGANVNVAVSKTGFAFTPANKDVAVHKAPSSYVCEISGTGFPSLKDAFAAATDGQTVKVTANHSFTESDGVEITGDKSVTLNLNNHTVTSTNGTNTVAFSLKDSASLTVVGSGTLEGTGGGGLIDVIGSGTITIASGTLTTNGGSAISCWPYGAGKIRISGGTLSTTNSDTYALVQNSGSGDIVMTGGTIETAGSHAIGVFSGDGGPITISGGSVSQSNSDGSAIATSSTSKVTIRGTAEITSSSAPGWMNGTITIGVAPATPATVLEIKDTATVSNNATPEGYSVNFFQPVVTATNISSYYSQGADATVGLIKPSYPSITIGAQTGAINYGTASTATFAVTGRFFDAPGFAPSVQWKSGTNWGTTAPTGITGTLSGSGDDRTLTVSTTATVNAGEYEFKLVSGDVESTGKVKIDKAEYPSKTQNFSVKSDTANAAATVSLPEIVGSAYGTVSVKTNTDSLISGTPTVSGTTLTMNVASKPEGTTAVLEIPVTNATNYKDFTMTVNITAKDKTAATITVPALDKTYNGTAVTAPTPTAVEQGTSTPVTLTYTYKWQKSNESSGYTDISGNTAPKDAGSYNLVIEGSSDTHAGTTEIAFTISKATVTITADNKSAYVGDAKPALTYTATGIASGDTLTTEPTLEYESEPDMSKAGSVKIKAKDAVAPNTDNYESAITYVDGTLTISTKSSGGGGGSSSTPPSGGSAGGVATPGKTVIDNPVGNQGSKNTLAEAVKNAIATGTTNPTVYTNFANYTALTKDGLKAINDATAAAVAGKNVQLSTKVQLDNKVGNAVVSRITVDPVKLATVMPDKLSLGVWFDQKQDRQVTTVTNLFEKSFDNKIVTVTFEQKSPLAVSMEFAAKPDLSALNTKNLYFYSYDPAKNIYSRISTPNYWVDKNGYSHFTAPFGGSVVISDKPLTKK